MALVIGGATLHATGPVMVAAATVPGPTISLWRMWIGVAGFGLITGLQVARRGWPPVDRRALRITLWAGALFGIHQLLMFTAVQTASVADVTLMNAFAPVVVGVGAARLFGERMTWRFRAWSALAMLGVVGVVLAASTGPTGEPVGMAMAAGNVIAFASFFVISKQSRNLLGVLPFLTGVMVIGALTVTAFVALTPVSAGAMTRTDWLIAAAVALGPGLIGHLAVTWPLRWVTANGPAVVKLAQPVLAGLLAWAVLSQPITIAQVIGGVVTLAGVAGALVAKPPSAPDPAIEPH